MKQLSIFIAILFLISESILAQDTIPHFSLGNDTTICLGEYIVLSALLPMSCNADYLWNDGSEEPNKIITKSGTYWVVVQSSCGSFQDTILIDFTACHSGCASLSSISGIYSSPHADIRGKSLVATQENDGFYVSGNKDDSVLIVKVDLSGNILWTRTFEIIPGGKHYVNAMTIDQDGILAIAGTFYLDFSGRYTSFMFRYDPILNQMLWAKEYIVEYSSTCLSMIQKPSNGNYLLTHDSGNFSSTVGGGSILEINKNTGDIVHVIAKDKTILYDLILKGNYIYSAGGYKSESEEFTRQSLMKLNAMDGSAIWVKAGEPFAQVGNVFAPDLLIDGSDIYSIYSDVYNKLHIQKTDLDGNLMWLKEYEINGRIVNANEIIKSGDGFIVYAQIYDTQELILFKINVDGNVLWAKSYYTLTNNFAVQAADAVDQIIEISNEIVFTSFSIDSLDMFSPVYPNMIIGRTNLTGNILSSCINQHNISIPEHTVKNPVFFEVHPASLNFSTEVHSFSPAINDSKVISRESCLMYDTIFNYYSAAICEGEIIEGYGSPGMYSDTFLTSSGCDSIRLLVLTTGFVTNSFVKKTICNGSEFEGYSTSGTYIDTFITTSGCDSIRTLQLNVITCQPIIYYNLDACRSVMADGSHMDYTEFTPSYPSNLSCASISAHYLYRDPPQMNKHSCTPGINDSPAMCITTLESCEYLPGNSASVVIEFTISPSVDSIVQLTGLGFYEKGPATYNWINGPTGSNNYPQFYAIRILKNDIEIYRKENIQTTPVWTLQTFDFLNDSFFKVTENSDFRIELLSYCPIGNGAEVSAWDIDEIKIYGGCLPIFQNKPILKGNVMTKENKGISGATIYLAENPEFESPEIRISDNKGSYSFDNLYHGNTCFLKGYKNDDVMNGVSTLDLIHIQRHLLGIAPFTSLHQFIAADINQSEGISVLDLVELRKLILGIYSEFPQNTSWRFGCLPQDMNNSNIALFRETASIESLQQDTQEVDFVGIKIGDLNGDVQLQVGVPKIQIRNDNSFDVFIEDKEFKSGQSFSIQFISGGSVRMAGLQFALDLKGMEFISLSGNSMTITSENYSVIDGKLRFSWCSMESLVISPSDILFSIVLKPTVSGLLSGWFTKMDHSLKPEMYLENFDILSLNFVLIDHKLKIPNVNFFGIEPNPVHSFAKIYFNLKEEGLTEIRFFDLSGRILHVIQHRYLPGTHSEEIEMNDLHFPNGLIYCQLKSNGFAQITRFLNLNY